jgi:transcriptional regulator with XRE-family HTH domain
MVRDETIGERVRRLREERGLARRQIASEGLSASTLAAIERGARRPSERALRRLAARLGVEPRHLEGGPDFTVLVDPVGWRVQAQDAQDALELGRVLLELARASGIAVPRAYFLGPDGTLVRGRVTRTDLAVDLGRCWCGRGALRQTGAGTFCCAAHEALWNRMDAQTRARVVAAQFIAIYGRRAA